MNPELKTLADRLEQLSRSKGSAETPAALRQIAQALSRIADHWSDSAESGGPKAVASDLGDLTNLTPDEIAFEVPDQVSLQSGDPPA